MFHLRIAMMAVRGLRQNLLRTMLATLGVVIGVGAVVSAVSILTGAEKQILGQFESLGADRVLVFNGSGRQNHHAANRSSLLLEDAEKIAADDKGLITAVSPQYNSSGQIKYFEKNVSAGILGATKSYSEVNDFHVSQGSFISKEHIRGSAMVCVLGHRVAKELLGAIPCVGKRVKINGKSFTIIGVLEERGAMGFVDVDNQVTIPITTAMGRMFGARYLRNIVVQCKSGELVPACIDVVKNALRESHRIRAGDYDDFQLFTQEQFMQGLGQASKILGIVLYSIAGISIVVGAIGIMNIMLVSVTERTREIGVRIAVGARRADILKQFLTEASIISCLGGAIGVVCGWSMANFLSEFTQAFEIYTPPMIVVMALVMAAVVGIISGIYPAIRAARLDPVQALRFE